jgi:hypothetical protein
MEHPQTLADRYVAIWNETDSRLRRTKIAALWVADGELYDGANGIRGYEALENRVRDSHNKFVKESGNRFRATLDARGLHDVVTFHWEMLSAKGEEVVGRGLEFLILNEEGQVLADYQFYPA